MLVNAACGTRQKSTKAAAAVSAFVQRKNSYKDGCCLICSPYSVRACQTTDCWWLPWLGYVSFCLPVCLSVCWCRHCAYPCACMEGRPGHCWHAQQPQSAELQGGLTPYNPRCCSVLLLAALLPPFPLMAFLGCKPPCISSTYAWGSASVLATHMRWPAIDCNGVFSSSTLPHPSQPARGTPLP